ncbi:MAG: class I SAM-dependent methyltransferase [Ginsengibacter sp.]
MDHEELNNDNSERNFTSISPSAKSLLRMKGYTRLPFAMQVAAIAIRPEKFEPDFQDKDFMFWTRVFHFEVRYKTIDLLLQDISIKNILELSSGFSFRGLDKVINNDIHFIDTDLPAIIEEKKEMLKELLTGIPTPKGKLELFPLNALDEKAFTTITNRFTSGPIIILNEGLMMYLNEEEKRKLCRIIHSILKERGGYWITADIYLKPPGNIPAFKMDDDLQPLLDQHKVNENMFESMKGATAFFESEGFTIDREAEPVYSQLDSYNYLIASASPEILAGMGKFPKIHATWRLKAV